MPQTPIEFDNRQSRMFDESLLGERLRQVIATLLLDAARITVALVDDAEIQRVNREFLDHDWPTDVISFNYAESADSPNSIDGELVVSVETAERQFSGHGWSLTDELLLYCVHGILHLCGYDDLTEEARPQMRQRERELLGLFGLVPTGLQD